MNALAPMSPPDPAVAHALADLEQSAHRAAAAVIQNPMSADEHTLGKARGAAHTAKALVEMLEDALGEVSE